MSPKVLKLGQMSKVLQNLTWFSRPSVTTVKWVGFPSKCLGRKLNIHLDVQNCRSRGPSGGFSGNASCRKLVSSWIETKADFFLYFSPNFIWISFRFLQAASPEYQNIYDWCENRICKSGYLYFCYDVKIIKHIFYCVNCFRIYLLDNFTDIFFELNLV